MKKRVLNEGWILQSELHKKNTKISLVGFSKRGLKASWAGSVKVSTSSKIIILGLSVNPKSPVPADSVKGYTLDLIASRLLSSLAFKKSARPTLSREVL
jgi:hypothetical protein